MLATFAVTSTLDTPVAGFGEAPGTLRQAIFDANNTAGLDDVVFDSSLSGLTLVLTEGELVVTEHVHINGSFATSFTLDASGNDPTPASDLGDGSRIFNIIDDGGLGKIGESTIIRALTLTGGDVSGDGGAIRSLEQMSVLESVITANASTGAGGAIFGSYFGFADFLLADSVVTGNAAALSGGGVDVTVFGGGGLMIWNSSLSSNSAGTDGGGAQLTGESVGLLNSSLTGNSSLGRGGGFYANSSEGELSAMNLLVTGNSATRGGGAYLAINLASLTILESTVSSNSATTAGGGLSVDSLDVSVNQKIVASTIDGNSAGTDGGGIHVELWEAPLELINSAVSNNFAGGHGGGIYRSHEGGTFPTKLTVRNSTISGNSANFEGGGLFVSGPFDASYTYIQHSTITNNRANADETGDEPGGGIFAATSEPRLNHSIVGDNLSFVGSSPVDDDLNGVFWSEFSLVGTTSGALFADFGGNIWNVDPGLVPLDSNGGPTQTHALTSTSPALDAGNSAIDDAPTYDQRQAPFNRIVGPRIDLGAFESLILLDIDASGVLDVADIDDLVQFVVDEDQSANLDFNGDGMVNQLDIDTWLNIAGVLSVGAPYLRGDANLDGIVDGSDFLAWSQNKFTQTAAWSAGDFTADGFVDGHDFLLWNQNKSVRPNVRLSALDVVVAPENRRYVVSANVAPLLCHDVVGQVRDDEHTVSSAENASYRRAWNKPNSIRRHGALDWVFADSQELNVALQLTLPCKAY